MTLPLYLVDAFTDKPFGGNPAAVCLLEQPMPDAWMQAVAAEMNLSETAFLLREVGIYNLRWFTPAVEVDLCGHATLASAHVLWEAGYLEPHEQARFETRSGQLTADAAGGGWIELYFPAPPPAPADALPGLLAALGLDGDRNRAEVLRSKFDYLVRVENEEQVRSARPDHAALRVLPVRGVILTAPGSSAGADFVSRFFTPGSGIDEDPVTGSAHCALAPYWAAELGKSDFTARQLSARGGVLRLRLLGERVAIQGQAVTVVRGMLSV